MSLGNVNVARIWDEQLGDLPAGSSFAKHPFDVANGNCLLGITGAKTPLVEFDTYQGDILSSTGKPTP